MQAQRCRWKLTTRHMLLPSSVDGGPEYCLTHQGTSLGEDLREHLQRCYLHLRYSECSSRIGLPPKLLLRQITLSVEVLEGSMISVD